MSVTDLASTALIAGALMAGGTALISALPVPEKSLVRTSFLLTFAVSLTLLVTYWNVSAFWGGGRQGFSYSDDETYHLQGVQMAAAGTVEDTESRNPGFTEWTAFLYRIFGPNTLNVRIFNIFFRCLWTLPVAFLALTCNNHHCTRLAIMLTAWAPSSILVSLLHIKDLLAGLAFLCALAAIVYLGRSRLSILVLVCSAWMLWIVRKDILLLLGVLIFLKALISLRRGANAAALTTLAAVALLLWFAIPILMDNWVLISGNESSVTNQIFEYTSQNAASAHGLAPFFITSAGQIWKLPAAMAVALLLPFPPDLHSGDIMLTALGLASIFVLLLMPFAAVGCVRLIETKKEAGLPIYGGFLGCLALLTLVFLGTPRYRESLMGLYCLLAAVGITERRSHPHLLAGSIFCACIVLVVGTATFV